MEIKVFYRAARLQFALAFLIVSWTSDLAHGQSAKELLDTAYEQTKSAKSIEQYDEIIRLCHEAQKGKLAPELADYAKKLLSWAHNRRGEQASEEAAELVAKGQTEEARALDAAALADFNEAVANEPDRWKALHNRGVSYALLGKYEEALRDFERVTKLKPDYLNAWFNQAEIRSELRQFEAAVKDYEEALKISPDDVGALVKRASALLRLDRAPEALQDLEKAEKLDAENPMVFVLRGEAQQSLAKWDEAAPAFQKAVALDSQNGRAYLALAWFMATCPLETYRNSDLAVQAAEKAIELDGDSDFHYADVLAAALANAERFDDAKVALEKAIEMAPTEEVPALKKRLDLYTQEKPFRLEPKRDTKTARSTSKK